VNGNGEDVTKKAKVFCLVREVHRGRLDHPDDIRPESPLEIGINAILGHEIEMNPHTTARMLGLSLDVSLQIAINSMQHDLKMKHCHLTGMSNG
jgi:hypothetical protein